ncbi:MAG: hypothetical protein AMJ79_12040, partial [Phycisphaerae bacterium SM23_30]
MPKQNRLMRFEQTPAPLLPVAQAVVVGILLSRFNFISPLIWMVLLALSLIAAGAWFFTPRLSNRLQRLNRLNGILLCLAFAAVAGIRYHLLYSYYPPNHIVRYCSDQQRLATLRGNIVTEPFLVKSSGSFAAFDFIHEPGTIFTLHCSDLLGRQGWIDAEGLVYVVVNQPRPLLRLGQKVQIDG